MTYKSWRLCCFLGLYEFPVVLVSASETVLVLSKRQDTESVDLNLSTVLSVVLEVERKGGNCFLTLQVQCEKRSCTLETRQYFLLIPELVGGMIFLWM